MKQENSIAHLLISFGDIMKARRIEIKVVPGAKVEQIQESIDGSLKICVKGKPVEGEANRSLIKVVSGYFHVPKNSVSIIRGQKTRNKLIQIEE